MTTPQTTVGGARVISAAERLVDAYEKDGNGVGVKSCEDTLIAEVSAYRGRATDRRCAYCDGPHPVSDAVAEESPFCAVCLPERVAARRTEVPAPPDIEARARAWYERNRIAGTYDLEHLDADEIGTIVNAYRSAVREELEGLKRELKNELDDTPIRQWFIQRLQLRLNAIG